MLVRAFFAAAVCTLFLCGPSTAWATSADPNSEADNYARLWILLEADRVGAQAFAGSTWSLPAFNLAYDIVVSQAYPGVVDPLQGAAFAAKVGDNYRAPTVRLEVGPAYSSGGLFLLPRIGLGYDFERAKVAPLAPQLISILQGGPLYVESWIQFFFYNMFDEGSQDSFYTRDLLLVATSNHFAIGGEIDLTVAIKNAPPSALRSLAFGPRMNWSPADPLTLGLFLGYESRESARNSEHDVLAGRASIALLW
jgi:hypothetical protein